MARSIWNGTITLRPDRRADQGELRDRGQDACTSIRSTTPTARASSTSGSRKDDKEVPYNDVVKGYEVSEAASTWCSRRRRSTSPPASGSHRIELEEFVDAPRSTPSFYDRTYYLGAGDGHDAYRLLHDALRTSTRRARALGSSTTASTSSRYGRSDDVLALHTMRFADELVDPERPRHPLAVAGAVQARDRDGGQRSSTRCTTLRSRRLSRQLPRARARADRDQGQGKEPELPRLERRTATRTDSGGGARGKPRGSGGSADGPLALVAAR